MNYHTKSYQVVAFELVADYDVGDNEERSYDREARRLRTNFSGADHHYGSIDAPLTLLAVGHHVAEADFLAVTLVRKRLRISVRTET